MDDPPLLRAFDLLVRSADSALANRALRAGISILISPDAHVSEPQRDVERGPSRVAAKSPKSGDLDTSVDWEPLRLELRSIVASSVPAQRVKIAHELAIAPSSLRNFISNATPGRAVAARVKQWLEDRQKQSGQNGQLVHSIEARAGAEANSNDVGEPPQHNRQVSEATARRDAAPNSASAAQNPRRTNGSAIGNAPNNAASSPTGELAPGRLPGPLRERLSFLIERDPKSARADSGVGIETLQQVANGAEVAGEVIARVVRYLAD